MSTNINLDSIDPSDRDAALQLASAIREQNALLAKATTEKKEKGWFSKAADAIESHPILTISVVCLVVAAAECYVLSRQSNS